MNSKGSTVLITGGSRGIGKATVDLFKEQGWTVATCSSHKEGLKNSLADFTFECDVTQVQSIQREISKLIQKIGKIDALVNNAGLSGENPMGPQSSDDLWHRIIDVNLNGTYYGCKYAAPYLPDGTGRIINIASVLALRGVPDAIAYCSAKHGVLGLTRALSHWLAPRKITVNAICPGWVRTQMAEDRMKEIGIQETDLKKSIPLGRLIEPAEVAELIYSLASSSATGMMTGQALILDGGATS